MKHQKLYIYTHDSVRNDSTKQKHKMHSRICNKEKMMKIETTTITDSTISFVNALAVSPSLSAPLSLSRM